MLSIFLFYLILLTQKGEKRKRKRKRKRKGKTCSKNVYTMEAIFNEHSSFI